MTYTYKAVITSVYDGDTVTADVDLGMRIWSKGEKLRLEGIDAPEVRGPSRPEGIVSRDYLRSRILNKEVTIVSHKRGKYGRWVCTIYLDDENINSTLVKQGLAILKNYD